MDTDDGKAARTANRVRFFSGFLIVVGVLEIIGGVLEVTAHDTGGWYFLVLGLLFIGGGVLYLNSGRRAARRQAARDE
jgi:hypothetical protein